MRRAVLLALITGLVWAGAAQSRAESADDIAAELERKYQGFLENVQQAAVRQADKLRQSNPAVFEDIAGKCPQVRETGKLARPHSRLERLPLIRETARELAGRAGQSQNFAKLVATCRVVSLAAKDYVAGAVHALALVEISGKGGGMAAALFGSGVLGRSDQNAAGEWLASDVAIAGKPIGKEFLALHEAYAKARDDERDVMVIGASKLWIVTTMQGEFYLELVYPFSRARLESLEREHPAIYAALGSCDALTGRIDDEMPGLPPADRLDEAYALARKLVETDLKAAWNSGDRKQYEKRLITYFACRTKALVDGDLWAALVLSLAYTYHKANDGWYAALILASDELGATDWKMVRDNLELIEPDHSRYDWAQNHLSELALFVE